ncbi:MAG: YebC/PmpR family DNA-binding transcriptional regulator [Gammaproteobacteria bacterium]|jgi:YebC/PmpR family DNA-binding regulatory protein|nr:YebC/PmpR family DNA-binding transcriptional regulator [Gammaproteobacteria bacterium]MEC7167300.1 YebC/PmpR family DNA-binding transcriptional regulator [Pseudomonadota bacterium]MEC7805222.1 YebC/PmpR family DNA-binding transcriptional regulator [Pseudomonadota bacterium]GIR08828.1 MAG: putative transcriptional regulatory protein [Gammaproteobacteria bacterium]|tara:strand:+ start:331 stop:1068 length:738 start_codon:yes stop_codon:yes gene_type:complete
MAGHSKWANIKHRKARQDAKRGAVFTKIIRELTVAAKEGGPIVEDNPRLRLAYDKALSANMAKDTINRAIQRGAGGQEGQNLEEVVYEGYAPGGVAVLIKTLTDNKNRTVSEIRHAFTKYGGNLGTSGSVAYMFEAKGKILVSADSSNDDFYELALEHGATDLVDLDEGKSEIVCDPKDLSNLKEKLTENDYAVDASEVVMEAETNINLDAEQSEKNIKLTDVLEDLDDVQEVFTNAELDQSVFS